MENGVRVEIEGHRHNFFFMRLTVRASILSNKYKYIQIVKHKPSVFRTLDVSHRFN